jgi:hypothetical protein
MEVRARRSGMIVPVKNGVMAAMMTAMATVRGGITAVMMRGGP